ncbi:hypothetical protein L615_005700000350, partial [Nocardioides sp. J9]
GSELHDWILPETTDSSLRRKPACGLGNLPPQPALKARWFRGSAPGRLAPQPPGVRAPGATNPSHLRDRRPTCGPDHPPSLLVAAFRHCDGYATEARLTPTSPPTHRKPPAGPDHPPYFLVAAFRHCDGYATEARLTPTGPPTHRKPPAGPDHPPYFLVAAFRVCAGYETAARRDHATIAYPTASRQPDPTTHPAFSPLRLRTVPAHQPQPISSLPVSPPRPASARGRGGRCCGGPPSSPPRRGGACPRPGPRGPRGRGA